MSSYTDHEQRSIETEQELSEFESSVGAFRACSEFSGPVEATNGQDLNDHFALIYENQEEQLDAAVSFMRQGIECGERCMYITDENSKAEVITALRTADTHVDTALESGALTIHTKQDTYLQGGEFDRDAMLEFWEHSLEQAVDEDGYTGIRAAAEMTWALDGDTSLDLLTEYEAVLNDLYEGKDYTVLCQYNRERFPAAAIHDVIKTHPYIIHKGAIYNNDYYEPPEEFFGPVQPANEVDRKLGTLNDRSEAKLELKQHQQYLHKQNEIAANPNQSFEEKLQALFELGCKRFNLELGAMARVIPETNRFEIEYTSGEHEHFKPGTELPLSETYSITVAENKAVGSVIDPPEEGYNNITVYQEFGLQAYLGTYVRVDGGTDRTFFFVTSEPRDQEFSAEERSFHQLLGQWVKYELEQQRRKQDQQTLYEIAADTGRTFDEKLRALFDLGCKRFGLDHGGIARINPEIDLFEVEAISGDHEYLIPGERYPLSETYCQLITDDEEIAGITDPESEGFEGKLCYEQFGVQAYLGTRIEVDGDIDRTLFFVSSEPQDEGFSDEERTFHRLMGQWVSYELERKRTEETLRESKEQLASDLAATRQLQETSTTLIQEDDIDTLYEEVLDAAVTIMDSNFASLQMLHPDQGKLQLLAHRGFSPEVAEFWEWVDPESSSTCGVALDTGQRVVVPKVRTCEFMSSTKDCDMYLRMGIHAVQTTPLVSRSGDILGMISTHWKQPHEPSDQDLRLLDVLGRQAADLIERTRSKEALEETAEKLEESNERLEQFAYAASHDLQEPLRMISSYLQLLENRYADDLDADAQEFIDFAVDGADRMREMIDALLQYSRLNRDSNNFEPVDCAVVLEEVLDNLQIAIEKSDAEITSDALPTVMGNKQQLVLLFQNLLDNAITYVGDESPRIHVGAEMSNGELVLSIRDNGIGIDPEKGEEIFEVFNRLHTTDEYPGTGIGLALCQRIVEIHNGHIWVDSEPGKGSTFSFTLPFEPEEYK